MAYPNYYQDEEQQPVVTAIGLTNLQGAPMFVVYTVANGAVTQTQHINPQSSHSMEAKQMLLKILEQALK
jgi:hypothetical protein